MSDKILSGPIIPNIYEDKTIGQFFFEHAEKYSEKIWQIDADTDFSETFQNMKKRSVRLALHLKKWGITSNNIIMNCSGNNPDCALPIISATYLGATIANIHPSLLPKQIKHLLTLVTPTVMFVEEACIDLIEGCLRETRINCRVIIYGDSDDYGKFSDLMKSGPSGDGGFRPVSVDVDSTAIIVFTSGTTGVPKAIRHSHRTFLHMVNRFVNCGCDFSSFLYFNSFYWISALGFLTCCVALGGTRIYSNIIDPVHILSSIEKYKVDTLFIAPSLTYALTDYKFVKNFDTTSVISVITGGTQIAIQQFPKIDEIFPSSNTMFLYGLSEIGACTFFHMMNDKDIIRTKPGSAGRPAPNIELKIVDVNTGQLMGPNETGEIYIRTPSLTIGYNLGDIREELDQDEFFRTGDIGYYDEDECIYVIERIKEMFKYMEWHIIPSMIEAVLLEHPNIAEACVFGIPQEKVGELPTACIVLQSGTNILEEEIDEFVVERLSDQERLRGGIFICEELLKTPTGKVMRNEIRNKYIKILTN